MRRNQLTKRLLAMLMALVMAMGLAVPGLAVSSIGIQRPGAPALNTGGTLPGYVPMTLDNSGSGAAAIAVDEEGNPTPPYQITISPGGYTATPPDSGPDTESALATRFNAYQIFSGSLSWDSDDRYEGTNVGENIWQGAHGTLSNVKWGDSVPTARIPGVLNALVSEVTNSHARVAASSVGITQDMIKNALARYEAAYEGSNLAALSAYTEEDWDDPIGGGAQNFEIDGTQYPTYAGALEAAREADLKDNFSSLTLAKLFWAALKYAGYEESGGDWRENGRTSDLAGTAKVVSQVLADFTDTDNNNLKLAETFAKILYHSSALGPVEAKSEWTGNAWTIGATEPKNGTYDAAEDHLHGGYYLIVDTYYSGNETDKSESDFMLGVYGDVMMTAKSDAPQVTKDIVNGEYNPLIPGTGNPRKGDDFEMGEEITFRLTGTLPQNFDNYDGFFYAFNDTMHQGLTYVEGSVRVYVKVENPLYDPEAAAGSDPEYKTVRYLNLDITEPLAGTSYSSGDTEHYFIYVNAPTSGETTLRIVFNDLQDLSFTDPRFSAQIKNQIGNNTNDGAYENRIGEILNALKMGYIKGEGGTEITVTYKAHLDKEAVLDGGEALLGNKNSVYLTYSNSVTQPTERGGYVIGTGAGLYNTANTTPDNVYPYTFGADLLKYDGTKTVSEVLEAGFTLNKSMTATEYALCDENDHIVMWISEAELLTYLGLSAAPTTWGNYSSYNTLGEIAAGSEGGTPGNFANYKLKFADEETVVTRTTAGTYYAIVAVNPAAGTNKYFLAGWILEAELAELLGAGSLDDVTEEVWEDPLTYEDIKDYLYPGFTNANNYSAILMTTEEDGRLLIDGLEDMGRDPNSHYVLTERIIPEGFEPLESSITIQFKAEYYTSAEGVKSAGQLKTLTATVTYNGADNALGFGTGVRSKDIFIVQDGEYVNADGDRTSPVANALRVHLSVANYPEGYLPGTGGIGTYLFYIGGGALLAGAVLLLILTNGKSGKRAEKREQR